MKRYLEELTAYYGVLGRDVNSEVLARLFRFCKDFRDIFLSFFVDCLWELIVAILSFAMILIAAICSPAIVLFKRIRHG